MNFGLLRVHQLEFDCIPCKLAFPQCGSRCVHAWWKSKPRHKHQVEKVGQLWPRCTKVYIVKSSTWELTGDVPSWKRGVSGNYIFVEWFRLQDRERSRFSLQGCKSSENFRKLHKSRPSLPERWVCECEGARRPHDGLPVI